MGVLICLFWFLFVSTISTTEKTSGTYLHRKLKSWLSTKLSRCLEKKLVKIHESQKFFPKLFLELLEYVFEAERECACVWGRAFGRLH